MNTINTNTINATTSNYEQKKLKIHCDIKAKLDYFIKQKKIPNIIFHGSSGCGKNVLVTDFINNIYSGNKSAMQNYVMNVNCAHGKGIRFIREELKFFSKTNVDLKDGEIFKTVVLLNADKLTIDAQSALRRCIELFSRSTRFFIIVEDKYKLLKPILSRFCEIYIPEPIINNCVTNLHTYNLNNVYTFKDSDATRRLYLKTALSGLIKKYDDTCSDGEKIKKISSKPHNNKHKEIISECMLLITKLYNKAFCSVDLLYYIEHNSKIEDLKKYEYLITFQKIKREFRNEKLLMLFILYFLIFRRDLTLENISFM
jgi:DNA polymerase III delta prime subunit